jgi:hypothetical protein
MRGDAARLRASTAWIVAGRVKPPAARSRRMRS